MWSGDQRHNVAEDNPEERRAQIDERLTMLSRAVEQSPSVVLITDRSGHIEYVNPRFTDLTGYSLGEVLGKTPRILKSGTMSTETYRRLWNTILSGEEWHSEFLNKKRDGTLYWQRSAISSIRDHPGVITHFIEVAEEITREKELESQLFQSQKMEAIGQLAGGLAHDFNNILTVIIGLGEIVKTKLDDRSEVYGYLLSMLQAAHKSSALTHQLLVFSRRQVLHPEVLDLGALLTDMAGMLRRVVGESVKFVTRLAENLPAVRLDQSQLQQVVLNLLVNATQAITTDGIIILSTAEVRIADEEIDLPESAETGTYVRLSVRDNGCGMDKETLRHIFEPFYTTKKSGTGLGLATVYGIVHQSGGQLSVHSEPGKGTTFNIYFPAVSGELTGLSAAQEETRDLSGNETILLVEDDDAVRATVNEILSAAGYSVILCANAAHALAFAETDPRPLDLLVTDVVLPEVDGIRLFHRLQGIRRNMRVLYISGYAESLLPLQREIDAGHVYLQKPFGRGQLLQAVRAALPAGMTGAKDRRSRSK